jgi:hypothetical protein
MWKMTGPSEGGNSEGWLEKAVFIDTMSATGERRINIAVSAIGAHPLGIRLFLLDVECSVTNTSYNLLKVFSNHYCFPSLDFSCIALSSSKVSGLTLVGIHITRNPQI